MKLNKFFKWLTLSLIMGPLVVATADQVVLELEHSDDLSVWNPVDVTPEMLRPDGKIQIGESAGAGFFRMRVETLSNVPDGFVLIPVGSFTMGDSLDGSSNAPAVNVYVSEFYMARHHVTWDQWNEVRYWAVNNGYTDLQDGAGEAGHHPVHSVNWWSVVKWCNARSQRDGLTAVYRNADGSVFKIGTSARTADWSADGYRLPTEAEWERAARGGLSGQRFPWGNEITHNHANYRSSSSYSYDTSSTRGYHPDYNYGVRPYTSPMSSFAPNGYGLYDMAGNVYDWCWDWYSASTYTEGVSDPRGPASGTIRVSRGGSWSTNAGYCRVANRYEYHPDDRDNDLGFRLARNL
jgi:formylglycine-generating enzyme